jgi:hypothetical protein
MCGCVVHGFVLLWERVSLCVEEPEVALGVLSMGISAPSVRKILLLKMASYAFGSLSLIPSNSESYKHEPRILSRYVHSCVNH